METLKLVITGAMGAGKTSAIRAISGIPPVCTEASTFQEVSHHTSKTTTTVAMDYGELVLSDGRILMIIGTPGQSRYDFMCTILAEGALGLIILIDHTAPNPTGDLRYFLKLYESILPSTPCVVGVTHTDEAAASSLDPYLHTLGDRVASIPVFAVDARSSEDIITVLQCLLAILETAALVEETPC
jgi:signal recognition particle receptor subunit beta